MSFCTSHFSSILLIGQFWRKIGRLRPFQRRFYAILLAMSNTYRGPTLPTWKDYSIDHMVGEKVHLTGVSTSPNGKPFRAVLDIRIEEQQFVSVDFYSDVIG